MSISITNSGQSFLFSSGVHTPHGLEIPSANTPPSSPSVGSTYFDTVLNQVRIYNGSVWQSTPGPTGTTGSTGSTGTTGSTGKTGSTGSTGTTGSTGSTGTTGSTGITGSTGSTGSTGITGSTGSTGPVGPVGPAGSSSSGPVFSAYAYGQQTNIANSVISFDRVDIDTDDVYNATNSRWTPGVAGYYQINTLVSCVVSAGSGDAYVVLRKNGSTWLTSSSRYSTSSQFMPLNISTIVYLSATDYVDIYGSATATVNTNATFGPGTNKTWVYFNGCFLRSQ